MGPGGVGGAGPEAHPNVTAYSFLLGEERIGAFMQQANLVAARVRFADLHTRTTLTSPYA